MLEVREKIEEKGVMALSAAPPLSSQYDEIISCTNVLLPGTEGGECGLLLASTAQTSLTPIKGWG